MNILVTGAAGFIAARTIELLLKDGHSIIGIDNLNDYYDIRLKKWRLKKISDDLNFTFIKSDIENFNKIKNIFKKNKFDAVINLAARAGVRYSLENPHIYLTTNSIGMLNILECMRIFNVNKIILASTSSLYAGQDMPFREELPVNTPISPYAATKKSAEVICYTYNHLFKIDVSILRYFTVYGPAGRPDMATFNFVKCIDKQIPLKLFGDGLQARDFTYIDDIARGTILAMKKLNYEIINLGGGKNPITINYLISKIEEYLGKKAIIDYKPVHKTDMQETWADITKAEKMLGWKPEISFDEGIKRTVEWYMENAEWLRNLK